MDHSIHDRLNIGDAELRNIPVFLFDAKTQVFFESAQKR